MANNKERRLGRGLEALLGKVAGIDSALESPLDSRDGQIGQNGGASSLHHQTLLEMAPFQGAPSQASGGISPSRGIGAEDADWLLQEHLASQPTRSVDIMLIDRNPHQPRQHFDEAELDALAGSLQTHGLLQPIVVRQMGERFQIIAGERRFRAATRAGWHEVPVHCLNVDERQMVELAITENVQRKDLSSIEKATAFAKYLEVYGGTHEELAKRLELDRSTVTNLIRLLDLPKPIQDAVQQGFLTQGHVRALLSLDEEEQVAIAARIQAECWNVRETEKYVRELIQSGNSADHQTWNIVEKDGTSRPAVAQSEQIMQLEQEFRNCLGGMKLKLKQTNEKGKGQLVISFGSHAEFELLHSILCQQEKKRVA
ncbi:MAG: ParB/RepB/Spo0J family partition protein [Thermoguttaceae bacterium]